MFHCRVCDEKDIRISELKELKDSKSDSLVAVKDAQIASLKEELSYFKARHEEQTAYFKDLLHPAPKPNYSENLINEDHLMNGGGEESTEVPLDVADTPEVLAERAAMLSGTY